MALNLREDQRGTDNLLNLIMGSVIALIIIVPIILMVTGVIKPPAGTPANPTQVTSTDDDGFGGQGLYIDSKTGTTKHGYDMGGGVHINTDGTLGYGY